MRSGTRPPLAAFRRASFLAAALIALFVSSAAAEAARTLLSWPTKINAFAQDGGNIAWIARAPNTWGDFCGRTYIRSLASGRQRAFGTPTKPVCGGWVALGRSRALWAASPGVCGNCIEDAVYTGALSDPRVTRVSPYLTYLNGGRQLTGLAADGRLRAFSWVEYTQLEQPDCLNEPVPCGFDVRGGRTTRVAGRARYRVPAVAPAALLAAGAGRIAVAPSADSWIGAENPPPAENGPVEVRDPITGALVMSIAPVGTVRDLALADAALAVLVRRSDGAVVIERYAVPAGTLATSTPVAAGASEIDIGKKWIVYRAGRQIRFVGPLGGDHLLVETPTRPIGVSIEGRRVAWAENQADRHRIRAMLVPK